ncbi:hypothetical protein BU23DRAFT_283034 [Bimuria novae-zelandiae CBS 107.79]|uniref:Uncharacterized protein n=1 Tax=Bimuria novae-zelandiae CBS 107.79 TaxID=1447943 RepID=A0A6A5UU28_9PLEO|nr:hypothetical protein BU23DRAFT_283034 [Bimuria novae-zelandiae CBS 107.79]
MNEHVTTRRNAGRAEPTQRPSQTEPQTRPQTPHKPAPHIHRVSTQTLMQRRLIYIAADQTDRTWTETPTRRAQKRS